jgi:hypothetical protein
MPFRERAPIDPMALAYPGFYRVRPGTLVEVGDKFVDEVGHTRHCTLDQVGRLVSAEQVVLRADRRRACGDEVAPPPRPRGVPGP